MKSYYARAARVALLLFTGFALLVFSQPAVAQSWHNTADPTDVNGDGLHFYDDFHILLSELALPQVSNADSGALPSVATPPPFYDVNNDGFISPFDAFSVGEAMETQPGVPAGTVAIDGPGVVVFDFQDLNGMAIDEVAIGQSFQLVASATTVAQDSLTTPTAAFFDLVYDVSLASVGNFEADDLFLPGTPNATGLASIGSTGLSPIDNDMVFTLELQATTEGVLTADGSNGFMTIIGTNEWTAPSFTSDSLTIVPEPTGLIGLTIGSLLFMGIRRRK